MADCSGDSGVSGCGLVQGTRQFLSIHGPGRRRREWGSLSEVAWEVDEDKLTNNGGHIDETTGASCSEPLQPLDSSLGWWAHWAWHGVGRSRGGCQTHQKGRNSGVQRPCSKCICSPDSVCGGRELARKSCKSYQGRYQRTAPQGTTHPQHQSQSPVKQRAVAIGTTISTITPDSPHLSILSFACTHSCTPAPPTISAPTAFLLWPAPNPILVESRARAQLDYPVPSDSVHTAVVEQIITRAAARLEGGRFQVSQSPSSKPSTHPTFTFPVATLLPHSDALLAAFLMHMAMHTLSGGPNT
ncbi:hypothetical protein B0T19DRAFT_237435 [Cercophora scortea]|uniref:Uncharacterized protein n=1 Tax=Cercophora scortea TaxID=314031 RepID=A0AAE0IGR6_9PEZI|nr:hypothetical protein B0T19DRAFT_237435 [Cercophora scortea]